VTVTLLRCRPRCCDAVSFSPSLCLLQQLWRARLREWFNLFLSGLEVLREERVTTLQARWRGIQARNVRRKLEAQRAKENRAALRIQVPYSTPLHSTPLHSTPLHSTPLHSTPLRCTVSSQLRPRYSFLCSHNRERGRTSLSGMTHGCSGDKYASSLPCVCILPSCCWACVLYARW
jgi:hypothetical protein